MCDCWRVLQVAAKAAEAGGGGGGGGGAGEEEEAARGRCEAAAEALLAKGHLQ